MNVTVCGCGRWGTFLAWYTAVQCHHTVTLYGRETSVHFQQLRRTHTNGLVTLPGKMNFSSDLHNAVESAQMVIISIGAQNLRGFLQPLSPEECAGKTLVLCMKGLESDTGLRLTQVVREHLPDADVAVWVGPGHVQDFLQGIPNCMVVDSDTQAVKERVVHAFSSPLIRFYYGEDLLGNEVGAAAKNVIGIAAGMLDGLNKTALKGALMSRGTREVGRLIQAMGGKEISAYGLAHLGDYEATVFSRYSHNRQFGEDFVRGIPYDKLAEGVPTVTALLRLGSQYRVELPICQAVDAVLNGGQDANKVLSGLFLRSLKMEF
ncbi:MULTISPECIES: NAD(P)H-dependent glycerol-3-phosphate dehydrogenase [Caproicibacterium]|jgi:glycerol-3-phosphate dehydrogenase (NAD(P)+)|uniref:Glycerol-3-phosphate dehydrogenase n=1 Tax=Caproicibacterium lactatifermentans TaxID=2666138 RepID=A0A859DVF5_9FIRM|nr:NAD(P)H-dependent glycerol-3-phosphate dehydrogenase [Caproicibacterium lactatifermentans]ARP49966.1 glycerol-3-phosphate dehydrogenase [Ruminococcaceae bacterium CPB6]QKN24313.1 NAD(P)H-dependent glycerol-3-phosphate dehydrogenase [Caproicibacterium lactatifermentans]